MATPENTEIISSYPDMKHAIHEKQFISDKWFNV